MSCTTQSLRAASELERRLQSGDFVVTAELTPPVSTDPAEFLERALRLKGVVTAVNVTDGAGARAHMSTLVAAHLLAESGVEPILQMTCRDRNRIAIQGDLLGAAALQVRNILVLRGDNPKAGNQPDAKPVYDLDTVSVLTMARQMATEHRLPCGTDIMGEVKLVLGATDIPVDPPANWIPLNLLAKAKAGARFIQTQFCMDIEVVRRYAARLVDLGIAQQSPILIGICPIPSPRSARWMRDKLFGTIIADAIVERLERSLHPREEGKRICIEFLRQLSEIPGIAGAHVMAPQFPDAVPEVVAESGVLPLKRAAI
jgi:methylenetetrahydrofolate reductase (NADPH)